MDPRTRMESVQLVNDFRMGWYGWKAEGEARATVLVLHGYGEHAARYEPLGLYLANRGYNVVAMDLRGHGRTDGKRGHVLKFDEYLDDIDQFLEQEKLEETMQPTYLVGHSMGGLVAVQYVLRHPRRFNAMILSNPLLGVAAKVPAVKALAGKVMSSVVPAFTMANGLDARHLARDPSVGQAYLADPLVHRVATARWYTEMLSAVDRSHRDAIEGIKIPLLLMVSTEDRMADASASRQLFDRMKIPAKALKVYEGLYHEIFNEYERARIFADLVDWLDQQGASAPKST